MFSRVLATTSSVKIGFQEKMQRFTGRNVNSFRCAAVSINHQAQYYERFTIITCDLNYNFIKKKC